MISLNTFRRAVIGQIMTLLSAAGLLLCVTGCDTTAGPVASSVSLPAAISQLQGRPDIVTAMTTYDTLLLNLRTQLTAAGITGSWRQSGKGDATICSDFGAQAATLNAQDRVTPDWVSPAGIPAARWPRALGILQKLGAAAGFTQFYVTSSGGDHHDMFIHGPNGSVMHFAAEQTVVISILSGCHRLPGKPIDPATPAAG